MHQPPMRPWPWEGSEPEGSGERPKKRQWSPAALAHAFSLRRHQLQFLSMTVSMTLRLHQRWRPKLIMHDLQELQVLTHDLQDHGIHLTGGGSRCMTA